jgi:hypothetical protein
VELIAMDEEERPDAHGKTQDVVKKMDSMLAKSAKSIDKKLEKLKEKYEKRGIVYISRLPPHLVRCFSNRNPNRCPDSFSLIVMFLPILHLFYRNHKSFVIC